MGRDLLQQDCMTGHRHGQRLTETGLYDRTQAWAETY
jgi:hypothetical protein